MGSTHDRSHFTVLIRAFSLSEPLPHSQFSETTELLESFEPRKLGLYPEQLPNSPETLLRPIAPFPSTLHRAPSSSERQRNFPSIGDRARPNVGQGNRSIGPSLSCVEAGRRLYLDIGR